MRTQKIALVAILSTVGICAGFAPVAMAQGPVPLPPGDQPPVSAPLIIGPLLGANFQDSPSGVGAVVVNVTPGGGFAKLGIQNGDVILAINGTVVADAATATTMFANAPPGTKFQIRVLDHNTKNVFTLWFST